VQIFSWLSAHSQDVVSFLVQALATLIGAVAAFALEAARQARLDKRQQEQERADETQNRVGQIRRALFSLMEQREFVINLKTQMLDPLADNPGRAYLLHPFTAKGPELPFPVEGLWFLLDSEGELLHKLVNADLRFRSLLSGIDHRNSLHLDFQQRLEPLQRRSTSGEITLGEIRDAMPVLFSHLRDVTDALYDQADRTLAMNREAFNLTREFAGKAFPGQKLLKVEELWPEKPATAPTVPTPPQTTPA
jgi:hypothetical protein